MLRKTDSTQPIRKDPAMNLMKRITTSNSINRCKTLLGTYVDVTIVGKQKSDVLLNISQRVFSRIQKIENLLSFHSDDSELSYVNFNAYYHPCIISDEMREVLEQALEISQLTDGFYDVSIASELVKNGFLPDKSIRSDNDASWKDISLVGNELKFLKNLQIDLGGIAKGYAVDQALKEVEGEDIDIIINAGGDLTMSHWSDKSVEIRVPSLKKFDVVNLKMKNSSVATSASYYFDKNKNPIISPKSKKMIKDKKSISVFAPNCMLADALTKVAFLHDNGESIIKSFGAQMVVIDDKGVVI